MRLGQIDHYNVFFYHAFFCFRSFSYVVVKQFSLSFHLPLYLDSLFLPSYQDVVIKPLGLICLISLCCPFREVGGNCCVSSYPIEHIICFTT